MATRMANPKASNIGCAPGDRNRPVGQLLDLSGDLLRGLPKLHPLQLGDARFELRDPQALRLDCAQQLPHLRLQCISVLWQIGEIDLRDGRVAIIAVIRASAFCRESIHRRHPAS